MIANEKKQSMMLIKALLRWMMMSLLLVSAQAFAQSTGMVTYVYTDPQGTPLAEADANGNVTATFDYTPYGTTALGNPPNEPGYTGHVNDPETNLVYMQARYYDAATGRFLSSDPIAAPESISKFNRYVYANNNPVVAIDPNGMDPQDVSNENWKKIDERCGVCLDSQNSGSTAKTLSTVHVTASTTSSSDGPQSLGYSSWSDPSRGTNGAISWNIIWILSKPSKLGGWVVQKMNIYQSYVANGKFRKFDRTYWEAWPVPPGGTHTVDYGNGTYQWDDAWGVGPVTTGSGTITWSGSARFYEGLTLPSSFQPNTDTNAKALPATSVDPRLPLQNATAPVARQLQTSWP